MTVPVIVPMPVVVAMPVVVVVFVPVVVVMLVTVVVVMLVPMIVVMLVPVVVLVAVDMVVVVRAFVIVTVTVAVIVPVVVFVAVIVALVERRQVDGVPPLGALGREVGDGLPRGELAHLEAARRDAHPDLAQAGDHHEGRQGQGLEGALDGLKGRARVQQGGHRHVSRDPRHEV
jgi:hypothetical protein